jgi:DNA-binding transcriptional ArsR family regulator
LNKDLFNDKFIKFFRALGNEERIQILKLLKENKELCAQEVEKNFYLEQSTISHHLNTLRRTGIVITRKSGRNIFYSLNLESLKASWAEFEKYFNN